jgi:hypothetical protein
MYPPGDAYDHWLPFSVPPSLDRVHDAIAGVQVPPAESFALLSLQALASLKVVGSAALPA